MGNTYDDAKFGVTERIWFGLPNTSAATGIVSGVYKGFTMGTTNAGTLTHVAAWKPHGPIRIQKVGVFVASTFYNASGGLANFYFTLTNNTASVIATVRMSSATVSKLVIASKAKGNLTTRNVNAGGYVTCQSLEANAIAGGGTATEVKATTLGAMAYFIDYKRRYVVGATQWD